VASSIAPPKNTGGGGFAFEDDVCSWLLAAVLVGEPVFGMSSGPPVRLDFQTRPDGWFLDDVLVTTETGTTSHRFSLSIKSNAQFTATAAPADFVATVWEQWFHIGSTKFDSTLDFMGLVTAPLSEAATSSLSGLSEKAYANDSNLFPSRLATAKWASENERALFASFSCPVSMGKAANEVDTARLMQRLRFSQHDFGSVASNSENRALELCRRAVHSQTSAEARNLWSILREVSAELRPKAGSITLFALVDRLCARVALAAYPDHASDWVTLDNRSLREVGLIRDSIANRVRVPRDGQVAKVILSITTYTQVALLGSSGVGKSALAKAAFEQRVSSGERTLWIDASSLDRAADFGAFEASLQLRHPFAELLARESGRLPLVILDGLDRLYAEHAFRAVASLLQMARGGPQGTQWRILAVCQSQEWPRILEGLQRAGAVDSWHLHTAAALRPPDLQPVRESVPALARLLLQPRVGPLLTNLKLLDLVVRRLDGGADVDASAWVGESSVADWFWNSEIERGADRLARGQFARVLAQAQADQLTSTVAVDDLEASSLNAAQSLIADQLLVQVSGDRLGFAHDLYGDWARLRLLLNHRTDLRTFLSVRHESPLWHRAIRLLGIHLLERENGVAEWQSLMASFDNGNLTVIRDLLLEAPAFAVNAGALLGSIIPSLASGEGILLRRLLTRFLAFATVPKEEMQAIARAVGLDASVARATYRRPHWPYWVDVLLVLHAHRTEVVRVAPDELARIVEMWLEFAPPKSIRREEAAELSVMLGQRALRSRDDYREKEERRRFYKCALLAAAERLEAVALMARTAAERIPRAESANDASQPSQSRARTRFGSGVLRGPWPHGPLARVDDEFRSVVLDSASILPLFRVSPAIAREIVLAVLIEPPHEESWGNSDFYDRQLDLVRHHNWNPTLFTHGPFLAFLHENFTDGLELIMQLLDFATDRSMADSPQEETKRSSKVSADDIDGSRSEQPQTADKTQRLALSGDGVHTQHFLGDAAVYAWSAGLGNPPDAIEASLMALEKYFYLRLDADEDISERVTAALARSRSVAALGVLCDVGKRQAQLFEGPLRSLLSAPEIYAWEIPKLGQGRIHMMLGVILQGIEFAKLAQEFHNLEHRKLDLRNVAVELLMKSAEMQSFFLAIRNWWKDRAAGGEHLPDIREQLDLMLDPANYEMREDPTHGTILLNVALQRLQTARAPEVQALNERMLIIGFPPRCRKILEERSAQTDGQLNELWKSWTRIRDLSKRALTTGEDQTLEEEHIHGILGGVAVFLWHESWLSQNVTRRQEVEEVLVSIMSGQSPKREGYLSAHDASTWTWDCFLADSAAMLWSRAQRDHRWRGLVAHLAFAEKYAAVKLLFSRCAEHRNALGEDFGRLRRLALDWAHVRRRAEVGSMQNTMSPSEGKVREQIGAEVSAWYERAISSFVDGTRTHVCTHWNVFDDAADFPLTEGRRRTSAHAELLDFHLVRCSHEWLPLPDVSQSAQERAEVIQFWQVALNVVTARPRADLERSDHQYPHEDEVWVLDHVAALVLQLREDEAPELFWEALIDLHSEAHDWPEQFLRALHRHALSLNPTPATYATLVRHITQRAFVNIQGKQRWPWHEEVWDSLIGIDAWLAHLWSARHSSHVLAIFDVVSLWMEKAPQEGRRLGKLAEWLSKASAASIRLRLLPWFLGQLQPEIERSIYKADEAEDSLAKLLNVIWDVDQVPLRASHESFAAFRGLLAWLVERQNPSGMELQGRIGGLA
jgi:hypothetical protein